MHEEDSFERTEFGHYVYQRIGASHNTQDAIVIEAVLQDGSGLVFAKTSRKRAKYQFCFRKF